MPNRIFFVNDTPNTAVAYDFSRTRQSADDIALGPGGWRGGAATDNRVYFFGFSSTTAVAYDFDGNRQSSDDIALGSGSWQGAFATNNRIFFINNSTNTAVAYDFDGNRQSSDDIALGTGDWTGGVATDNRIYLVATGSTTAVAYDFSGTAQSGDNIALGSGSWRGGAATNNRIFFINNSTNTAVAYDFSGTAQSGDNIALGTGDWTGGASIFESDATYTLSTTDTDIRAGESVAIDVISDVDVSGLAQADFSITNGAITSLSITDARNAVLTVVAGVAGTMTVTLAENAGSPDNAETSQDFTVNAIATVAIAFDDSTLETGASTTARIVTSEPTTGLTLSELSVNVGSVTNLQRIAANSYTATVTAPSSGSGTLTLTIAENAFDQRNAEETESLTYAPPTEAFTVAVSGTTNIQQGQQTTLTATVTDSGGNTPIGTLMYAWSASRGSFVGNATGAVVTYDADFTDSNDVDVDITCSVTRAADATPTSSGASLTAMTEIGITGQLLNMYLTALGAIADPANNVVYNSSTGTLATGSDDDLTADLHIHQIRWDNTADDNDFVLNRDSSGDLNAYFSGNNSQSVYLIFENGTYAELSPSDYEAGGSSWARWNVADATIVALLDGLTTTSNLLVGVADAGSIGINAGAGSGMVQVTATTVPSAVLTIATTDTDIREGETVFFTITSDIDITDFLLTDITLTGASAVSLASLGNRSWQFQTTAGAGAGSIVVSIAENMVLPGNAAVSETFTRSARATVSITFADSALETGQTTTATITVSETVTGLERSDLTLDTGTLGATLTAVSGTVYTIPVTAPSSGSGTMTLSIAQDATLPQNAAASASIAYAPPAANIPPVFGQASYTFADADVSMGDTVGTVAATDADGDPLTYSLTGTDAARFAISGAGVITNAAALAFSTTYTFNVVADDGTDTTSVTVSVTTRAAPPFAQSSAIVSGDNQSAQVGTTLANPLVIQVNDQNGDPLPNAILHWSTLDGGTISGEEDRTGADGRASATFTLGATAGDYRVVVGVTGLANLIFTLNARTTVAITFADNALKSGETTPATITFGEAVTGAERSDLTLDIGTLGGTLTEVSGSVYTIPVTAPSSGSGTMTLSIAEDATLPENVAASASLNYAPNVAPVFPQASYTFSNIAVSVNAPVGTVMATDADNDTLSYSLTGTDASRFSINSNGQIAVATELDTETAYTFNVVVNDGTDTASATVSVTSGSAFSFEFSMLAQSSYDLSLITEDADSITFRTGQTQPAGSSIANGVFTIGTVDGTAFFTATNDNGSTNFQIKVNVVQTDVDLESVADATRHRVEIAEGDVSADFLQIPSVSESLDAVSLNTYSVNAAEVVLVSDNGKYNSNIANNFWTENNLNLGGYQERINIFREALINGVWVSDLLFSGLILRATDNLTDITVTLTCVDISSVLRNRVISDFGTLEKWAVLDTESASTDRIFTYAPEDSLSPVQTDTARAWRDQTELTLEKTTLPTEGPPSSDLAQITSEGIKTLGSLSDDPILRAKTYPQSRSVEYLANQIALSAGLYQVNFDVDAIGLENPYILNRGSVSYSVEKTRITRVLVDWVHDETNDRLLILLSHPDTQIADVLVERNLANGNDRVLYEFDNDIRLYRIARLNSTTYYLLTTSYSDSDNESIYQYETDTDTLTERVTPSNTYPPRRSSNFKTSGNNLYYGYALRNITNDPIEAGVAQLATNGTVTSVINDSDRAFQSTFDITDTGEIYLVSIGGGGYSQTLASTAGAYQSDRTFNVNAQDVTDLEIEYRVTSTADPDGTYTVRIYINGTLEFTGNGTSGTTLRQSLGSFDSITSIRFVQTDLVGIYQFRARASINPPNPLKIQRRLTDGTIQELADDAIDENALQARSVSDVLYHNDSLYIFYTSQPTGTTNQSALEFMRFDVSGNTIPLPGDVIIDSNTNTLFEPSHLFVHENSVHFMRATTLGSISRVETDGSYTNLGNLWYEGDTAWNQPIVRPLSIEDKIHTIMGYGDLQGDILDDEADTSQRDNMQHLIYGETLEYVIRDAVFSGSIYAGLADLAKLVDATLSIENGIIHIRQRRALTAETDGATGTGTADIDFQNANRAFPTSGYLSIGDEFIQYTGISGDAFTGITRGVLGTTVADHADESQCIYLNQVISEAQLVGSTRIQDDTARLYNVIQNSSGSVEVRDADSIAKYGEKVLTLDLAHLTDHDRIWQETIFNRYLENLKDLRYLITLRLEPTRSLRLGDVIGFRYAGTLLYVMQIVSRTLTDSQTEIQGLTLPI